MDASGDGVALSESGPLPTGVAFTDNGNSAATLAGNASSGGSFPIAITATAGSLTVTQSFTLTVQRASVFLSDSPPATVNLGGSYSYRFTSSTNLLPATYSLVSGAPS